MNVRVAKDTEEGPIQAYQRNIYIVAFASILEDLKDRLDSSLIKVFINIEDTLMNSIRVSDMPLYIELIDKKYENESGAPYPPLEGMNVFNLKEKLMYLC